MVACIHMTMVDWGFGRARNHPKADAVFLRGDASARHRDGGGSSQAVDLRDGARFILLNPNANQLTQFDRVSWAFKG
jgi:hypothetical protein